VVLGVPPVFRIGADCFKQVKVKLTLEQATKAQRGSRDTALLFLYLGPRWGWVVIATPRPFCPPERGSVPIVQEAGWALWPVWTGAENLAPFGIRFPARPARSESLFGLRFPCHSLKQYWNGIAI
jgi:hypothetical protein